MPLARIKCIRRIQINTPASVCYEEAKLSHRIPREINRIVATLGFLALLIFTAPAIGASDPQSKAQSGPDSALLERAIDGGDPSAMNDIGVFYDDIANNTNEALKWFLKGALAGSKPARLNLAMALFSGRGFPKDRAQALFWMRLAEIDGPVLSEGTLVNPSLARKMSEAEQQRGNELFEKFKTTQTIPSEAIPILPTVVLPSN